MDIKISDIVDEYAVAIGIAYNQMYYELKKFLTGEVVRPFDFELTCSGSIRIIPFKDISSKDLRFNRIRQILGRCGGRCGAAAKRAKTTAIVRYMLCNMNADTDMTGEVANRFSKNVLGRGINRGDRSKFATPGRTASNKSRAYIDSIEKITKHEFIAGVMISELEEHLDQRRKQCAEQWILLFKKDDNI